MLIGEGLSLLDLTAAPGWTGLNTGALVARLSAPLSGFFEQLLHRPLQGGEFGLSPDMAKEAAVLAGPRRHEEPRPQRLPVAERLHAATDPNAVTSWGKAAAARLKARGDALRVATQHLPPGYAFPWQQLGLPYQAPALNAQLPPEWSRQVRMLSLISFPSA